MLTPRRDRSLTSPAAKCYGFLTSCVATVVIMLGGRVQFYRWILRAEDTTLLIRYPDTSKKAMVCTCNRPVGSAATRPRHPVNYRLE